MLLARSAFLIALASISVDAQVVSSASRPAGYRGFIETFLLDRAPVVVQAGFRKEDEVAGLLVSVYDVKSALRGASASRVTVLEAGTLTETTRRREHLLFLEPTPSGLLYRLIDAVDLSGDFGEETLETVRHAIAVSKSGSVRDRREGLRKLTFGGLASLGDFSLKLGAREVVRATESWPGLFGAADLPRLREALQRIPREERGRFSAAIGALEAAERRGYLGVDAGLSASDRELFQAALGRLMDSPAPSERRAVVDQIVRRFGRSADHFLSAALEDSRLDVRLEALRLIGVVGVADAGPAVLRCFLRSVTDERAAAASALGRLGVREATSELAVAALDFADPAAAAALVALRRIGDDAARAALVEAADRARRNPPEPTLVALLAELSDAEWAARDVEMRDDEARPYRR